MTFSLNTYPDIFPDLRHPNQAIGPPAGYIFSPSFIRMRACAVEEGIQHHDLLWIIDQMHQVAILTAPQVVAALEAMLADPRSPVPKQELAQRLRSFTG